MQQNSYAFKIEFDANNSYTFTTDNGIDYAVKFVPSDYLFDQVPELGLNAFEMVIAVTDARGLDKLPADSHVSYTVMTIFNHFFDHHEKVIVFVCDTSDNRQRARARKFNAWFYRALKEINPLIAKLDRSVIEDGGEQILMSMFIHIRHPHRLAAIDAFFEIGNDDK